ncbi:hypothetical protein IWT25_02382 [Secundilactobacillus pentosiphilus]|uniref:Uncharacterized protein n=1 Tax=Secundilactobacillus pentosiphilus TaxID=1714682 RepID=A0A1Z5IZ16_9LACO|nr:hypothetical protein IWT25_02382 [Secundilactobacillus pentosiphilus]
MFYCCAGAAAVTVIADVAVLPPEVTVIVAVPALTAVTVPSFATVATVASLEVNAGVASVALFGVTVTFSLTVLPTSTEAVVWSKLTPVTGMLVGSTTRSWRTS